VAALAGGQGGIVHSDRALQFVFAFPREAAETHIDRGHRRLGRTHQIYIAHGQRAGELAQLVIDENGGDIVLGGEELDDIAPTLAHVAGIELPAKGKLKGRLISEALAGGGQVNVSRRTIQSQPAENGARTILNLQQVGEARYFDAAGFAGKAVGLAPP